jgi:alpha/beta superfamily hydrolase
MKTLRWLIVFAFAAVVAYQLLSTLLKANAVVIAAPASARATGVPQVVEKIREGANTTKDAVVKGATIAADKTKEGLSKSGEVITNEWITTRVHRVVNHLTIGPKH